MISCAAAVLLGWGLCRRIQAIVGAFSSGPVLTRARPSSWPFADFQRTQYPHSFVRGQPERTRRRSRAKYGGSYKGLVADDGGWILARAAKAYSDTLTTVQSDLSTRCVLHLKSFVCIGFEPTLKGASSLQCPSRHIHDAFCALSGRKGHLPAENHGQDFGAAGSWRLCGRRGTDQGQFLISYLAKLPVIVPVMSSKSSVTIQCNLHKLVVFINESLWGLAWMGNLRLNRCLECSVLRCVTLTVMRKKCVPLINTHQNGFHITVGPNAATWLGDTANAEQSFSRLKGGLRMIGAGPLMHLYRESWRMVEWEKLTNQTSRHQTVELQNEPFNGGRFKLVRQKVAVATGPARWLMLGRPRPPWNIN